MPRFWRSSSRQHGVRGGVCKLSYSPLAQVYSPPAAGGAVAFNGYSTLFDGTDELVTMGNVLGFERTDPFTIAGWGKCTGGFRQTVAGKQFNLNSPLNEPAYGLSTRSNGTLSAAVQSNNQGRIDVRGSTAINDGVWRHLAMTYNGSSLAAGVVLYINGAVDPPTVFADTLAGSILTAEPFRVGSRGGPQPNPWNGNLDEVAVWDAVLTLAEIAAVYNAGVPADLLLHSRAANLVGWWRMGDGDTFPTLQDSSVSGFDGTMINMEVGDIVADVP